MVDTLSPEMILDGPDTLDRLPILAETMFADHKGVGNRRSIISNASLPRSSRTKDGFWRRVSSLSL